MEHMPRRPRVHFPGALYHVIARGNRGQRVFLDSQDYQRYIIFLKEYKEKYEFLLYAYALMPNHLHLLLEVNQVPLSQLMQNLQSRYTRNFNLKYKKWGHLFQGRYKAILCQKDSYFIELSAYIHLNPVRAGLVKRPIDYQWSSYRFYQKVGKDSPVDDDLLLAQFSNNKAAARKAYSLFVEERIAQGHRKDFYELKDQCFLGSEQFVEDIQRWVDNRPPTFYNIPLTEIVFQVSSVFNLPIELFYTPTRNRKGAWGRKVAAYLAKNLGNYQIKIVADHFRRDPVVISKGIKSLEETLRKDESTAEKIAVLEQILIRDRKESIVN